MADIGLATASSTRPLLPLSPRSELGARTRARRYGHDPPLHSSRWRLSRFFLFHSSFVCCYTLALHYNIAMKYCRPRWKNQGRNKRRLRRRWRRRWRKCGGGWRRKTGLGWSRCSSTCRTLLRAWDSLCLRHRR